MPKYSDWTDGAVSEDEWNSFWEWVVNAQESFLGVDEDGDCRYRVVLMDRVKYSDAVLVPKLGRDGVTLADITEAAAVAEEANSRLQTLIRFYRWDRES
jgi:hypothetical protein